MVTRSSDGSIRDKYTARPVQQFVKVQGLGNDFLVVEGDAADLPQLRQRAPALCNRRLGVGADGILLVGPPSTTDAVRTMWVINHDGSRPEMCGNGLRCVALFVAAQVQRSTVTIDTDDGPKRCVVSPVPTETPHAGMHAEVQVDMGSARHGEPTTPQSGDGRHFASVSMGNPHAIAFVGADEDPEMLARRWGPGLEVDAAFPEGTNVEFARVDGGSIVLWVWERGCGITDACGTGACATAAAAVAQGLLAADTAIVVQLPGGPLAITVGTDRTVRMRGAATIVYRGELPR